MDTATVITIISMLPKMIKRLFMLVTCIAFIAGCTAVPGLDLNIHQERHGAPSEINGFDLVEVTPEVVVQLNRHPIPYHGASQTLNRRLRSFNEDQASLDEKSGYRVGPGDILSIVVWDHPELTNPTGEFRDPESAGRLVDNHGRIFYPYIGTLKVEGLNVAQIREIIARKLARVVRSPQVDVRVAGFRSQRVKIIGEVHQPNVFPITDRPLTMLEAIAMAGGLTERANRRFAILNRNGVDYRIDLIRMNRNKRLESEAILRDGDVLEIPRLDDQKVFLLGAVGSQSAIEMPLGTISLAEALSQASGLNGSSANRKNVYIVRAMNSESEGARSANGIATAVRPTIYKFSFDNISTLLLSERFQLWPRDVVYVDRTGLATYNSIISQVLPTVSTLFQLDRLFLDE